MNKLAKSQLKYIKNFFLGALTLFLVKYYGSFIESFSVFIAMVCTILPEIIFRKIVNISSGKSPKQIISIMYKGCFLKHLITIIMFILVFVFLPIINMEVFIISYVVLKFIYVAVVSYSLRV